MLALGWGLAAVVGAVAGTMVAPVVYLEPNMMASILLYGFASTNWLAPARWLAWGEWLLWFQMWLVFVLALHFGRSRGQTWVLVGTMVLLGLTGSREE